MTDQQLLTIFRFPDTASNDLDSLTHAQQRLADLGVLCSVVLYSVNRKTRT